MTHGFGQVRTIVAALAGITLVWAGGAGAQTPKTGGTLRYGTVSEVASLDPHIYSGSAWRVLIEALYSPLVGYDQNGKIVPRLAEWETPDSKTTVFRLRQGTTFHDGSPVTAEDVKFSLERILNPATGATLRTNLDGLKVTAVDDGTVRVETAQPNATLLSVLAFPEAAVVSRKWMQGGPNVKVQANGTGPFRLKSYEPSVRAELEKNPSYIVKGQPYLQSVDFRIIKSDDARVNALRTGSVDMIDFVPWKDIDALRRQPSLVVDSAGGAFMNIWFNATKKPFDDPRVRRALGYAIDRAGISKAAFFGHGSPIFGPPSTPDSPFYNKNLESAFAYDPQRAKQFLAEAGLPNGFSFEFLVYQGLGIYTSTAQIIQQNLKEIGITANIRLVEFATLLEHKNNANYDAMIYGVSVKLTDPDAYAYYFGADSSYWAKPIGYRDETLEKLLAEGRATLDQAKRKDIYHEVEKRLLDTSPWVFINWREQAQGYRRNVKGYKHLSGALSESSPGISLPLMWME
jgi:ABC-type transport system substrate-binding protein